MNIADNIPNNIEHWLNISGYDNYQVSNFGRVRNSTTGRILKGSVNAWGYLQVNLSKDGKIKKQWINNLKRTNLPQDVRICSMHFEDTCFKRDLEVPF